MNEMLADINKERKEKNQHHKQIVAQKDKKFEELQYHFHKLQLNYRLNNYNPNEFYHQSK